MASHKFVRALTQDISLNARISVHRWIGKAHIRKRDQSPCLEYLCILRLVNEFNCHPRMKLYLMRNYTFYLRGTQMNAENADFSFRISAISVFSVQKNGFLEKSRTLSEIISANALPYPDLFAFNNDAIPV